MSYNDIYFGPDTNPLFYDRGFWIYFIITLFFIIIGVTLIAPNFEMSMIIATLWILGNLALMMMIYHASNLWGPNQKICVIDDNLGCFKSGNKGWLIINILFIVLLIIGTIWTGEYHNMNTNGQTELQTMTGILMLLGGLLLCGLSNYKVQKSEIPDSFESMIPLAFGVFYLIIWFVLTLYTLKNS